MLNTLHKSERLDKKKVIDKMFSGGARSFSVFPLRVVYLPVEELEAPVSILVSVSKRRFKRAVKRNRVKRQIGAGPVRSAAGQSYLGSGLRSSSRRLLFSRLFYRFFPLL